MDTLRQFETLIINDYEADISPFATHVHTYYELIYIYKGNGAHFLNDNNISYKSGDLFLISPEDKHHFEVKQTTRFVVIKFTDSYFKEGALDIFPETIMRLKFLKEVKLEFKNPHKSLLQNTIRNIVVYKESENLATSPYIYLQLLSVFGLIKEVILKYNDIGSPGLADKEALLSFIHQNIYDPKKYQVKNIAKHFNISATYFGDYFKRNFNVSYRYYINQYRTTLIEKRIEGGKVNMKQIAEEFGFNDESHLSNYFKKRHQLRPSVYRKKNI
ncbi:AraC-type DNA-binding protein [Chitinophaga sp. YR573]|uniref:AraC family transcriptional regulator n=1 Tax=Chitinophaga sp. YR573 TaxID=1881040 RepID=UPI0008D61E1C|nr:helix-turn-helix transcriptional regulator [Chitinophaga sp. YR573]SEW26931.1 AraC-type DNA-binding protein [Chitinophaga sp. YR573]